MQTTQETVSLSSKLSSASVMTDKGQTLNTDVAKAENVSADTKKDSKNQKTKGSNKSQEKKKEEIETDKIPVQIEKPETAISVEENLNWSISQSEERRTKHNTAPELVNHASKKEVPDKNIRECKSPQSDRKAKNYHSTTKSQEKASDKLMQIEKEAANTFEKTCKASQKVKKNKQEKQIEIKTSCEGEKQSGSKDVKVKVKENTEIKVFSDPKEIKTELKQEIKKVTLSPATASVPAVPEIITDRQVDTPTPTKKKKKSKKSKGGAQAGQAKDISAETNTETKILMSEKHHQTKETIAVSQIHQSIKNEHVEVKSEVITTEGTDRHSSQQQRGVQKHVKASHKKKGVSVTEQSTEEPMVTGGPEQNQLVTSTAAGTEESQRRSDVQVLISNITEIQTVSEKTDSKSLKTLINTVPEWLTSSESKCELEASVGESNAHKNEDNLSSVREFAETKLMHLGFNETMEKDECEAVSEKGVAGGATPRISKISIGSTKVDNQIKKNTSQERKDEVSLGKAFDLRVPSPSLRMRSPSPTFITIESTRRTDSPQRVTPSPTLLHRPPTPPTPPPRRCETPTSRLTRITPSPTFDRAENLARLKDTTAKLSRGVTPPPLLSPQQVSEKRSEIVESPPSFHRQIKIQSQVVETHAGEDEAHIVDTSGISEPSSASVKEKREFFEEAQKAEINKTYVRKQPIAIPERLGPDMEECEEENKNKEKDEVPRADLSSLVNKFESPEEKKYIRKELVPLAEWLHDDAESTDCDKEKIDIREQGMPTFDIQAIKNVFELGEQSSSFGEEKRDREESVSNLSDTTADFSKWESPQETKGPEPSALSENKSTSEHFSNVDEFGNEVTGTRASVTEHFESVSAQRAPFSYADAVKRKAAAVGRTQTYDEDATEKLLRNFHKTWTESETVFKSLGYTISEETMSQFVSSEVGALHSLSAESLSDGCPDSGQKKVP
uniref:Uncharacterized protein n=1 Tax=Echeneis naucrates TaxID=173247 RepID=A0A665UAM2_ECHNA